MKVAFFSARAYDAAYFDDKGHHHQFTFINERLDGTTAGLAKGHQAVCVSAEDTVDKAVIIELLNLKIDFIIVRASGTDNIDMATAYNNDITVKWLPGFSPLAIAEHAVTLLLALNRKIHVASERVKKGDFSIEGLEGFNLYRKTVGIVGWGRVGSAFAEIMKGFGCPILANDIKKDGDLTNDGVQFVSLPDLLQRSDIISLHCSLNEVSEGMINSKTLKLMKHGAILINTARGKLVNTSAVLEALDKGILSAYGADVYENESNFFHKTFKSLEDVNDPVLKTLINHPHVLLTAHQAYFTKEGMQQMARTVINELTYYESLISGSADRLMI